MPDRDDWWDWLEDKLERLNKRLDRIEELLDPTPGEPVKLSLTLTEAHMAFTMKDTDPAATASVTFTDAGGNATTPDDVPQWASSDTAILTVTAAADGLSASVAAVGPTGNANVSVTSTDTNGTVLTGSEAVTVVGGEAVAASVNIVAG